MYCLWDNEYLFVGCKDKTIPLEERKYFFNHPIYFAGTSKVWGGGIAFLDYQHKGKSFGKIYKIKMNQFKGILAQELRCKLYNAIILVDYVDKLPNDFVKIGSTKTCKIATMANDEKKLYGVQFHPEVNQTENGSIIIDNFIKKVCKCKKTWKMNTFTKQKIEELES